MTPPAGGKIEILSIPTAAALVGLTAKALRTRVAKGEFPSRVLGRRRVILRNDLEQFLLRLPGTTVDQALRAVAAQDHNGMKMAAR